MKKIIKKVACFSGVLMFCLGLVFSIECCSDGGESVKKVEDTVNKDFEKDLKAISNFLKDSYSANLTRGMELENDSISSEKMLAVQKEIETFLSKYDLFGDLSHKELENNYVTEEMKDSMLIDHQAFQDYLQRCKSPDYLRLIETLSNNPKFVSEEIILNNDGLKMNEKVELMILKDLYEPIEPVFDEPGYQISVCDDKYQNKILDCRINYAGAVVLAFVASVGSGPAGVVAGVVATSLYINCLSSAARDYKLCKEEQHGRK